MFLGTEQGQPYSEGQLTDMLTRQGVKNIVRFDFIAPPNPEF